MPKRYGSKFFGGALEAVMWVLLLVPFIGLLWVPFYNFYELALFGFRSSIGTSLHGCRSVQC